MTVTPELAAAEHKAQQPMSNAHCRFAPASRHHWDRVDSFSQRAGGTAHEDSTGLQQRRAVHRLHSSSPDWRRLDDGTRGRPPGYRAAAVSQVHHLAAVTQLLSIAHCRLANFSHIPTSTLSLPLLSSPPQSLTNLFVAAVIRNEQGSFKTTARVQIWVKEWIQKLERISWKKHVLKSGQI